MTGVYKLTNVITGQFYIGASIDIKRRWMEHKTPKARGNDRLHNDMKEYGIQNFLFEVIEECGRPELREREHYYIRELNPYYNFIGKSCPPETREKVSNGIKDWWKTLPEETKNKIITKNLTGPKKGHIVSEETRAKISKKVSEVQKQKVRCIETGIVYSSIGEFEEAVGAHRGTCWFYWKGKIKSVKGYHIEKV